MEVVDEYPPDVELVRIPHHPQKVLGPGREPAGDLEGVVQPDGDKYAVALLFGKKAQQAGLFQYARGEVGVVEGCAVLEGAEVAELGEAAQIVAKGGHFGKQQTPRVATLSDQQRRLADVMGMQLLQVEVSLQIGIGTPEGVAVGGEPGAQRRKFREACSVRHLSPSW